jgi:hypothetical protein
LRLLRLSNQKKGKNRSAADKAKIAAGVRARNRAILLEKLEKLGMTEEAWFEKKKLLKYLRERVRRAKKAKDEKAVKEHQHTLDKALADQKRVTVTTTTTTGQQQSNSQAVPEQEQQLPTNNVSKKPPKKQKPSQQPSAAEERTPPKTKSNDNLDSGRTEQQDTASITTSTTSKPPPPNNKSPDESTAAEPEGVKLSQIFARDIHWTHHRYDQSELDSPYEVCPNNGPGGLICCADCTKQYSAFLTLTATDMEEQKTHKVIKEVNELMGFLNGAKTKLEDGMEQAKQWTGTRGPLHRVIDKPRFFVAAAQSSRITPQSVVKPAARLTTKLPSTKARQRSNSQQKPSPQSNTRKHLVPRNEHQNVALPPPNNGDGSVPPICSFHFSDTDSTPMLGLGADHQQLFDDDKAEAVEIVAV